MGNCLLNNVDDKSLSKNLTESTIYSLKTILNFDCEEKFKPIKTAAIDETFTFGSSSVEQINNTEQLSENNTTYCLKSTFNNEDCMRQKLLSSSTLSFNESTYSIQHKNLDQCSIISDLCEKISIGKTKPFMVEIENIPNKILILDTNQTATPKLCRPEKIIDDLQINRAVNFTKSKIITNQELGFCIPKSSGQIRLIMLMPQDSKDGWSKIMKFARYRTLLAIERRTRCQIKTSNETFLYRGKVVKPLIIDGPNKNAVLRCRNCLPDSLRESIIYHEFDAKFGNFMQFDPKEFISFN